MPIPKIEFLLDASTRSLHELELASLNRAANISKTLRVELDVWVEEMACAMLIRWLIENREELLKPRELPSPRKVEFLPESKKQA